MKIICIGRNYVDHAKELNNPVPKSPLVFMKPPSALLTDNKPFYHPDFSTDIHYELEVVLRIKKNGKAIQPPFASSYYDQIGLGIDFTARDLQDQCKEKGHPWEIAKAFDHSAVISPFVDLDKYDRSAIKFQLQKNGVVVQDGNTDIEVQDNDGKIALHLACKNGHLKVIYFLLREGVAKEGQLCIMPDTLGI